MARRDALGVALLAAVATVTAAWWALALWPLGSAAPMWIAHARWVCFGSLPDGLPNTGGWIALVGEPIAMTALLFVVWGDAVRSGVRQLAASAGGRVALGAAVVAGGAGLTAAGVRVANAAVRPVSDAGAEPVAAVTRLDRAAPPLALLDQSGQRFALEQLRGRPVLLTFAFGHCETVCPLVVHDVREAARLTPDVNAAIVVVSLDPWRDLPTRLPAIARAWELPDDAHALSGSVAEVQATLDAWAMAIGRDSLTGDITHPVVVHVIDRTGRIAFTAPGGAALLADLLRRL